MKRERIGTATATRAIIVFAVIALAFVAVAVRILFLQTVLFDHYQKKVVDQLTTESTISPERGRIYDADGSLLAANVTAYRVFISPSGIKSLMQKSYDEGNAELIHADQLIAEGLAGILGMEVDDVLELTKKTSSLDMTVKRDVDRATADEVLRFISDHGLGNVVFAEATSKRYYPYGTLAANILGFTDADGNGLYGLESYYNDTLSGTPGKYIIARDSRGNELPFEYESFIEPMNGNDVNTTIRRRIQSILEDQLRATCEESDAAVGGCGIVMNVKTGAIYAMAKYPSYDNNVPYTLVPFYAEMLEGAPFESDSDDYKKYRASLYEQMWMNYAVSNTYIPGSTFKIITTAMGLESGVVTTGENFTCTGSITVGDSVIHCHKVRGHGTLTFAEGLQQSCNPILITVGERLGTATFRSYLENFGYFAKTGIDLPGEALTYIWPESKMGTVELATAAFGQNFQVTAINHLTAIAAVANGGHLVRPYLVESVTDPDGNLVWKHETEVERQVVSEDICRTVSQILEAGVSGDGGAKNAYVPGYRVAAKTGTSEKIGSGNDRARIGSCVGYAPAEDPEIAVIIVVDEPTRGSLYGSSVAAPYIAECMSQMLPYLGVEVRYSEAEQARLNVGIGDYRGKVAADARNEIEKLGIRCEVVGVGTVVTGQIPEAGSSLNRQYGKVLLYVGDTALPEPTVAVPVLVGLTAEEANNAIANAGFNVCVDGSINYDLGDGARVISQSPAAGELRSRGDVITVKFRYTAESDD